VPARPRFEDLLALPLEAWIDDTHVRRVRFDGGRAAGMGVVTLDLDDFGVEVDDLDWSRLPTFRSPEEAEWLAEQRAKRSRS
jgi:hypothetical protein